MRETALDLRRVESLPRWGPFTRGDAWHWSEDSRDRWLDLEAYQRAMVDTGALEAVAQDIVSRLRSHGCEQIYWRGVVGGFLSRITAAWDVRVAVTDAPAAEAVPNIIGMGPPPVGATPLGFVERHPAVLRAWTSPVQSEQLRQTKRYLGGRLPVSGRVTTRCDYMGYVVVAVGNIGATISTGHKTQASVQESLVRLVELLLRDLEST